MILVGTKTDKAAFHGLFCNITLHAFAHAFETHNFQKTSKLLAIIFFHGSTRTFNNIVNSDHPLTIGSLREIP